LRGRSSETQFRQQCPPFVSERRKHFSSLSESCRLFSIVTVEKTLCGVKLNDKFLFREA
jgi:hypothetical protein